MVVDEIFFLSSRRTIEEVGEWVSNCFPCTCCFHSMCHLLQSCACDEGWCVVLGLPSGKQELKGRTIGDRQPVWIFIFFHSRWGGEEGGCPLKRIEGKITLEYRFRLLEL